MRRFCSHGVGMVAGMRTPIIASSAAVFASLALAPVAHAEPSPTGSTSPSSSPSSSPSASTSPSPSTSPTPACTSTAPNDLNNDGQSDLVIAQPKAKVRGVQGAGAVDVRVSNGGSFRLTSASVGAGDATSGLRFGQSAAIGDLNADCYADLLIGVPRYNNSTGRVVFVPGSANGVDLPGTKVISVDTATTGDRFGHAVAIGNGTAFIGAPFTDDNTIKNSGRIYLMTQDAGTFSVVGTLAQGSGVVKDTPEAGDHYGKVLTFHDQTLAVGMPEENIDGAVDAGALHLTTVPKTDPTKPQSDVFVSQNSPGVPGGAEKDDHFGAAFDEQLLAVGIPGEDLKTVSNAGGIITGIMSATTTQPAMRWVSQSSSGIPGKSKPGDKFGSALSSGRGLLCTGQTGIAVGIPHKRLGSKTNAGMVTVVSQQSTDCGSLRGRKYTQDSADIAGKVVRGNRFGSAFVSVPGTEIDAVLAGVPGANLDDKKNTGRVVNAVNAPTTSLRALGGLQAGTNYGNISTGR